jgi:capsule polysaccharide export protein KpsE/RkpR
LKKTKWYDNLLTEDFKRLNIKKHKKLLWFLLIINIYIWITIHRLSFYGV